MYTTKGLVNKVKKKMKQKIISETCVYLTYTYLITSSSRHEGRDLGMNPFMFFSHSINPFRRNYNKGIKFLDEIGENSDL